MSRELVFLPEVRQDFIDTFQYYESLSPRSGGARFETVFKRAIQQVKSGVITHKTAFGIYHRVLLTPFPYTLYYRLLDERVVIVGLLYARFEPSKIERLLKGRNQ